jgi:hypothetical protein
VTWFITGNANIDPTKFLGTINNQPLIIKTNQLADNSEKVRVNPDGNVGIGKAPASGTPYKLDVAGAINATDIHKNGAPLSVSQWEDVSGGISYAAGNVGIGTADLMARLNVVTSVSGERAHGIYAVASGDGTDPKWGIVAGADGGGEKWGDTLPQSRALIGTMVGSGRLA